MGQRKTLGGDRLGAGKRQQVDTRTFNRSTHDLGYTWRSTMSVGTLVPFMVEVALPADSFDINLGCEVLTLPTLGPLFGSMKVQLDVFTAPVRLYQGQLHNNKLGVGLNMAAVKLPVMPMEVPLFTEARIKQLIQDGNIDNAHINPSSIFSYLGMRGLGIPSQDGGTAPVRKFNAVPLLAYWDIYKNYYANKQETNGWVIHTTPKAVTEVVTEFLNNNEVVSQYPAFTGANFGGGFDIETTAELDPTTIMVGLIVEGSWNGTTWEYEWVRLDQLADQTSVTALLWRGNYKYATYGNRSVAVWRYINETDVIQEDIDLVPFALDDIDKMREQIMVHATENTAFDIINDGGGLFPYALLDDKTAAQRSIMGSQEGLGIKTYMSDLFNNWLNTEYIDGVNGIAAVTAVSTAGDEFTIDSLILHKKVYDMLNDVLISGGTYDDWQEVVYDHEGIRRAETPIYWGSLIKELQFQEVVSNSETNTGNGTQPLGTLAGRGRLGGKHKGGNINIKVDEISYIIGIVSITPRLDYSQGNDWHVNLETMDDFHKPHLDEIGFQELVTEQMAWWDTAYNTEGGIVRKSAGKQPAWLNYMTNVNRVKGNFAIQNNSMFMVLTRRYQPEHNVDRLMHIGDLTTYVDPRHFNHIFAQTSLDSQNYWVQVGVDMTARRKMSARVMPNL